MLRLNHIGIAVADLPQLRTLLEQLGMEVVRTEAVVQQGVRAHFVSQPRAGEARDIGTQLELLEALDSESTVSRFIEKRGPGIHHLSFEVSQGELAPLCDRLLKAGTRLLYDAPRPGVEGTRVNFVHPASAGGVLIELTESA